jgi:hypothetical protein
MITGPRTTTERAVLEQVPARRPAQQPIIRPRPVSTYNRGRDGVDLNDKLCPYYNMERKCMKLYKKLFWRYIFCFLIILRRYDKQETFLTAVNGYTGYMNKLEIMIF